ncbi:DUF808 domain-containing protein [Roseomonas nepalensis]|uniref:DUF808 domain-containing protein n=1 Tax=Muricoccus nepalensis TaxID=1854500 RepID=A0A502GK05_9PROT|nr:DUF808 domain-containing protein [Roseomonas nepalensis]TPG61143.1 DUF808 domain-containing protein [Roseomonas nepalensis]
MSIGLLAILDDLAALTKVAAASLDDVVGQAAKAGTKAVGVVVDDAAVTPRYVVGFAASRELPVVGRIALGSLRNKLLFLLPGFLLLSIMAPWSMTPLLMLGGTYLCFEGAEKVLHALRPPHLPSAAAAAAPADPAALEERRVASAIRTDFILSAEIMALTLASLEPGPVLTRALVLAIVGTGLTVLVYGAVALIVKADDAGVALARNARPASTRLGLRAAPGGAPTAADRGLVRLTRPLGRGLVRGMPPFLRVLGVVGTAAMLWVGGGIVLHGLEAFGVAAPAHLVQHLAERAAEALPSLAGAAGWSTGAALSGLAGLGVGLAVIPLASLVLAPLVRAAAALLPGGRKQSA